MPRPPTLFVLVGEELFSGKDSPFATAPFGADGSSSAPEALARALASSPAWASMPGAAAAVLVARPGPQPAVAVLGRFDEAAEARLKALRAPLRATLERLRYVSYAQAEQDCQALARRLLQRFGRAEVRRFRFAGIPRGGLVALGMLSYALGLEQDRLAAPYPPEKPLVVVDDCALTGSRFGRFLENCEHREVVFAPLYAHPDLRVAIEKEEPRVRACMSARDLHDHGPERLGDAYAGWKERWKERSDGPRYWVGQPDHVCFPWSEPDVGIWNPAAEAVEHGWRVVPPAHCLKNRPLAGNAPAVPVQVQPLGRGPLRPARHVLFGTFEERLVVAHTQKEESFSLTGVAAAMWRALIEHGSAARAQDALRSAYDVDDATLEADLRNFVKDLRAKDLLEEKRHAATPKS